MAKCTCARSAILSHLSVSHLRLSRFLSLSLALASAPHPGTLDARSRQASQRAGSRGRAPAYDTSMPAGTVSTVTSCDTGMNVLLMTVAVPRGKV